MKFEVIIGGRPAQLTVDGSHIRYEASSGEAIERDFSVEQAGEFFSVLMNGRSYRVKMLSGGEISVHGRVMRVEVFDPRELRSGKRSGEAEGRRTLAAPMPGRVIRVLVEAGQEVDEGQGLIVVEAMKMQNEMKSPKSGRIVEVKTKAGAAVSAGEALVVVE